MRASLLMLGCMLLPLTSLMAEKKAFEQTGMASWYGNEFKGHKMANGKRYNPDDLTAAHRSLPFGTRVKVTNLRNSKCTTVEITNRGPFIKRRIIDVSRAAAKELDMMRSGTARVKIEVISDSRVAEGR